MKFCGKCGSQIYDGNQFCTVCGAPVSVEVNEIQPVPASQPVLAPQPTEKKKSKKPLIITLAIVIPVLVIALVTFLLLSDVFASVEDLCAKGKYLEAYEKAEKDQRYDVMVENAVAVQYACVAANDMVLSNFELKTAYYYDSSYEKGIVLQVDGMDGYGADATSYWSFAWDDVEEEWKSNGFVYHLDEEEIMDYYDLETRVQILTDNIHRALIETWMQMGTELDEASIQRIHELYEKDLLDQVELLEVG